MKTLIKSIFLVIALLSTVTVIAVPRMEQLNTRIQQTESQALQYTKDQYAKLDRSTQKNIADMWGLSTDEYSHYFRLMQNSSSGKWYKQLNPAEVLGIDAKNNQQRMYFAKIVVRNAHNRVSKELAFQRAYDEAQKILYPAQMPIEMPNLQSHASSNKLQPGDMLLLFADLSNRYTAHIVGRLTNIIGNHPSTKLNVYIVGKNISDNDIRTWANKNKITPSLVTKNVITLNHDNGRFMKITHGSKRLPLVVLDRLGKFEPIQISSIW